MPRALIFTPSAISKIGVAIIDSGIQDRPDLHGAKGYNVI